MPEFRMPSLGADMESGILVEWLVKPGQPVKRGQVVAVVETQKGAVEVEIWDDGVVDQLIAAPGTKVPVGEVLATLVGPGGAPAAAPALPPSPMVTRTAAAAAVAMAPPTRAAMTSALRPKVSPAARRLAERLGVDLTRVPATGPDASIQLADVERAAQAEAPAPKAAPTVADKQAAMRQAIAAAMAKSKREIPHYYLGTTLSVERAAQWLTAQNAQRSVKERILFAAVLLRAVALALREVPELNGWWREGRFEPAQAVHLGVGLALRGGGLIAPAIHDAQDKRVPELMAALSDLIQRTRAGTVRSSELTDGTVTVTNLGEQGVDMVYGVIYPPQVALIGFGKVVERPWVDNGELCVRRVVHATLSADHRASVGHRGALFLAALDRLLQHPEEL